MLTKEQEDRLYLLSETLGVEIYVVGVGDRQFLPAQESRPASASTREGALTEWMMACLEASEEIPWWTHTHPGMSAFFSTTDVAGAHNLWASIKRPIMATVLGKEGERHDVVIDGKWIEENPKPKPITGFQGAESWDWRDDLERHGWVPRQEPLWVPYRGWAYQDEGGVVRSLASTVVDLVQEYGWEEVYECVRLCAHMADDVESLPEDLRKEVQAQRAEEMIETLEAPKRDGDRDVPPGYEIWRDPVQMGDVRVADLWDDYYADIEVCPGCNQRPQLDSDLPGTCRRCGYLLGQTEGR